MLQGPHLMEDDMHLVESFPTTFLMNGWGDLMNCRWKIPSQASLIFSLIHICYPMNLAKKFLKNIVSGVFVGGLRSDTLPCDCPCVCLCGPHTTKYITVLLLVCSFVFGKSLNKFAHRAHGHVSACVLFLHFADS